MLGIALTRSISIASRRAFGLSRPQSLRPPLGLARRAQFHTLSRSLAGRLWFKRDGTPRSKIRGLAFVTAISGCLYSTYSLMLVIQELDTATYLLSSLVNAQRVDYRFENVDFDNSKDALAHFRSLCGSFTDVPRQMVDDFFDDVAHLDKQEAIQIVKDACRDIHNILFQSKDREPLEIASEVITMLDEALVGLIGMVEDNRADEDAQVYRHLRIKDQSAKDTTRSSDYETLG